MKTILIVLSVVQVALFGALLGISIYQIELGDRVLARCEGSDGRD